MLRLAGFAALAACVFMAACSPAPQSEAASVATAPRPSGSPVPVAASSVKGVAVPSVQRYVLDDTEVRNVHASKLNRDYQVFFATLYVFTLLGLVLQLIGDVLKMLIDPRIDFEARDV